MKFLAVPFLIPVFLGQILIGVTRAILIVGLAALAERRSCNPPGRSWRSIDSDNHGHE